MSIKRILMLALCALPILATPDAMAAEIEPAIIYSTGGKFDCSFNEGAYRGAENFKKNNGIDYVDFEPQNDTQSEQALRRFAQKGHNPIVAIGFAHASAMSKVAP